MGLRESLQAIEELPFSVVYEDDKNMLQFPVFVCQSIVNGVVEKEQVYVNSKIK